MPTLPESAEDVHFAVWVEDDDPDRSFAFVNQDIFGPIDVDPATVKEMLLLKFTKPDRSGTERPVRVITWFGIHPTDRGQKNTLVCGDNKGAAKRHCARAAEGEIKNRVAREALWF